MKSQLTKELNISNESWIEMKMISQFKGNQHKYMGFYPSGTIAQS